MSFPPENSFTLCTTLTPLGSVEQAGFFFLAPVCGGLTRTFRLRMISDCEGARRRLRSDGTASDELIELLPASLPLASPVSVQVGSARSLVDANVCFAHAQ